MFTKKIQSVINVQVMRRLRERAEPIRLFGESDRDCCIRLRYDSYSTEQHNYTETTKVIQIIEVVNMDVHTAYLN